METLVDQLVQLGYYRFLNDEDVTTVTAFHIKGAIACKRTQGVFSTWILRI